MNDEATRTSICEGLKGLGIREESEFVRILPSREDEQIARHTWQLTTQAINSKPTIAAVHSELST